VLSAKYGLLAPEDTVGPNDVYLADRPREYRQAWDAFVTVQLTGLRGDLRGCVIEVHAGGTWTHYALATTAVEPRHRRSSHNDRAPIAAWPPASSEPSRRRSAGAGTDAGSPPAP
jgi:hypothetical protein